MTVLSIQSAVAYGHVGNAAAVFALQRLGIEAWPVNTVAFSNHPGHGGFRGRVTPPEELDDVVRGLAELGALARCRAVLSGYLGEARQGEAVLAAVERVRAASPGALYCLAPVMGNRTAGIFVRGGIPEFFRDRAVARADMLVANLFELGFLAGGGLSGVAEARDAAAALRERGPRVVAVTGIPAAGGDGLATLVVDDAAARCVRVPFVAAPANGAGDLFAALFLGRYLQTQSVETSLAHAASAVHAVLSATRESGSDELALIAAQDALAKPEPLLPVRRLADREIRPPSSGRCG